MSLFCGKCGAKRDSRSKYCIGCGKEFKSAYKEEETKKENKESSAATSSAKVAKPKWMRIVIVAGGVAAVVLAVLLVFWLATSFHKEEQGPEAVTADLGSPLGLVDQARAKADAGDLAGAIKQLEEVTKKNPKEGVFFWYLADFYREQGNLEAGIRALEKCYECYKEDSFWGPESLKKKEELRRELIRIKSGAKGAKK
jgi:cytochrome c-type biogenesis protein CcmH/NrfG